jgi:hypothetical protein
MIVCDRDCGAELPYMIRGGILQDGKGRHIHLQ